MLQSSAYVTKRCPRRSNSPSSSSSTRLLSTGEKRSFLRSPFHAGADQPVLHHSGIQECPNESQQPFVPDPLRDPTHEFAGIDSIEKLLRIEVNTPAMARGNILLSLCHRTSRRFGLSVGSAFRLGSASLALPTTRPTTPSADFCPAVELPSDNPSRRSDTEQISWGKFSRLPCTAAGSTLHTFDGY
jgi:hypothetical protein